VGRHRKHCAFSRALKTADNPIERQALEAKLGFERKRLASLRPPVTIAPCEHHLEVCPVKALEAAITREHGLILQKDALLLEKDALLAEQEFMRS
jgi:hypothetical protein